MQSIKTDTVIPYVMLIQTEPLLVNEEPEFPAPDIDEAVKNKSQAESGEIGLDDIRDPAPKPT